MLKKVKEERGAVSVFESRSEEGKVERCGRG
jgi:hypothetical protein